MQHRLRFLLPVLVVAACGEDQSPISQGPPEGPEPPGETEGPEGIMSRPFDLVYVCGNKFLATNTTRVPVQVTYRVVGTMKPVASPCRRRRPQIQPTPKLNWRR